MAAQQAFNLHGGGSSPSDFTKNIHKKQTSHGIEVLAAACPALNRIGDGSSPSDPACSALG